MAAGRGRGDAAAAAAAAAGYSSSPPMCVCGRAMAEGGNWMEVGAGGVARVLIGVGIHPGKEGGGREGELLALGQCGCKETSACGGREGKGQR